MLATSADALPVGEEWVFEPKLDGYRCLAFRPDVAAFSSEAAGEVVLRSRTAKTYGPRFGSVAAAVARWDVGPVVLDGELVVFDGGRPSFQAIQGYADGGDTGEVSLSYAVFDVLHLHGRSTRGLTFAERRRLLEALPPPPPGITRSPVSDDGEGLLGLMRERGWEGVVAKTVTSTYVGRRSPSWRKIKVSHRQEFAVCGFTEPQGARVGFGALLLAFHDGAGYVFCGRVGSGFTQAQLRELGARLSATEVARPSVARNVPRERGLHWVEPTIVVEVTFGEWTHDDLLRHPRFAGLRHDKAPADVRREDGPTDRRTGSA